MGGVEGKDSIRLTQLNLLDNNRFCLISVYVPEGIVMSSDSRQSITIEG
ncbi:unnamed protein product, partial [marine sediment metagenome]